MLPSDLHKHADTDAKLWRARTKYLTLTALVTLQYSGGREQDLKALLAIADTHSKKSQAAAFVPP